MFTVVLRSKFQIKIEFQSSMKTKVSVFGNLFNTVPMINMLIGIKSNLMILSSFSTLKIEVAFPLHLIKIFSISRKLLIKNRAMKAFGSLFQRKSMNLVLKLLTIFMPEILLLENIFHTMVIVFGSHLNK